MPGAQGSRLADPRGMGMRSNRPSEDFIIRRVEKLREILRKRDFAFPTCWIVAMSIAKHGDLIPVSTVNKRAHK